MGKSGKTVKRETKGRGLSYERFIVAFKKKIVRFFFFVRYFESFHCMKVKSLESFCHPDCSSVLFNQTSFLNLQSNKIINLINYCFCVSVRTGVEPCTPAGH